MNSKFNKLFNTIMEDANSSNEDIVKEFIEEFENWEPYYGPHHFRWSDYGQTGEDNSEYYFNWEEPGTDIYITITLLKNGEIEFECDFNDECKTFEKGDYYNVKAHFDDVMYQHDYE